MANKNKVYEDYEKIAEWFDRVRVRDLILEKPYLEIVITQTKPNGKILDLGCGMGEPVAKYFIDKGYQVTGIDGSQKMIEKARRYVPQAQFCVQDMRYLCLNEKFDAIILWHSFFHLRQDDQRAMFKRFEKLMNPNGILLFTSGDKTGEIWSHNGGENLYHASLETAEYQKLLKLHHFEVIIHKIKDEECGDATVWVCKFEALDLK